MVHKQEPQIEIEDLQPKSSIAGYRATLKADGVAAHIELLPLQDQPARGFFLEVYTSNESTRPMGKRQQERANELIPLVRARMLEAMKQAGWSVVGKLESPPMDIWQHSSRLAASSASKQDQAATAPALQVEPDQGKRRKVLAIPANTERRQKDGYTRTITAQEVSFDCERCANKVTRTMFPGREPRYCDDCAIEVKREKTRERVARYRAAQKGEQKKRVTHTSYTTNKHSM